MQSTFSRSRRAAAILPRRSRAAPDCSLAPLPRSGRRERCWADTPRTSIRRAQGKRFARRREAGSTDRPNRNSIAARSEPSGREIGAHPFQQRMPGGDRHRQIALDGLNRAQHFLAERQPRLVARIDDHDGGQRRGHESDREDQPQADLPRQRTLEAGGDQPFGGRPGGIPPPGELLPPRRRRPGIPRGPPAANREIFPARNQTA